MHTVEWFNSSIRPLYGTLAATTTPGQSGPRSNGSESVLPIPQSSSTDSSPADGLVSYTGHSFGGEDLTPLQRCS